MMWMFHKDERGGEQSNDCHELQVAWAAFAKCTDRQTKVQAVSQLNRAVRSNPIDGATRLARGMYFQSVGMYGTAMRDFEAAAKYTKMSSLRFAAQAALSKLETFQIKLLERMLAEDVSFRRQYDWDAKAALDERGFQLTNMGRQILRVLVSTISERPAQQAGVC